MSAKQFPGRIIPDRINRSAGILLAACAALAGCAVGPNYKRAEVGAPAAFRGEPAQAPSASLADTPWWDIYHDEALTALIRTALSDGFDARIAAARVEESRSIAAEVHGQLFPGVGYAGDADRGRNAILGSPFPSGGGAISDGFAGYFGAAWEFDLWGRVRRLDEAAKAQYLATEQVRRGVAITLVSEVATGYFDLLELDDRLAIARHETESYGETLKLFNQRLAGGIASKLETASAEAAQAASAAQVPDLERQIALQENEISVLIGRNPGPVVRGTALAAQRTPPEVPAGLPSALLERRPDVRAAEEQAHAANAQIGVTVGGFLPRIGLNALFGGVSPQLQGVTSPGGRLWSGGIGITGPLFQGGSLRGQYTQAKAAWEEAKLRYQQTALTAFKEVADALVTIQKLAAVRAQQERAVAAYDEAFRVAKERYAAGRAGYYEVLQAQQQLFPAQALLAQVQRDQLAAVVELYRALGGGWEAAGEASTPKR